MQPTFHQIVATGNLEHIREAVAAGADVNAQSTALEERPLSTAISSIEDLAIRHEVVALLLDAGANPKLLDDQNERLGPLFKAVLAQDAQSLQLLLHAGADPNGELGTERESLYDWAEFDYRYENGWLGAFPEAPSESDRMPEEAWLNFLERIATRAGKPLPHHLQVLRRAGALSYSEISRTSLRDDTSQETPPK